MAIGSPGKLAGSLSERLIAGETRAAITFAGQGADVLPGLTALLDRRPELDDQLDGAAAVLARLAASPEGAESGRFRYGFDVRDWVDDPEGAPPAGYLRSCAVSYPLVLLAQLLAWNDLCVLAEGDLGLVGVTGHSSGLLAALAVAKGPVGPVDDSRLARWLEIAFRTGLDLATAAWAVPAGPDGPGPMAAVSGVRLDQLTAIVDEVNSCLTDPAQAAVVGLVNAPDRHVVSGPPATLEVLRSRLAAIAAAHERDRAAGRPPEVALRYRWEALAVDVPFHWPGLAPSLDRHLPWLAGGSLLPDPERLSLPVLSPADGSDLRGVADRAALAEAVARSQFVEPVRWDRTVAALVAGGAEWILDLGPGVEVARLTGRNVRGLGPRVLPLASPEGLRILATRGAAPTGPDLRYADLAPRLVEGRGPGGGRRLDNRYTRATGQPPVVLPGMTPTTADAPIVAAAANAGFTAELAGGGQPAPWIFHERVAELRDLLDPGVGIVLNSLYLDRALWSAQVGSPDGLLFAAKQAGAPFVGLTVSAGIPEADEAVALLDRLRAAGMVRNAFKPGTVDQIRQVLAIADAAPQHTVLVHIEGGRAGGHHSHEDLDELLLATYHDLRVRPNVVVCVGGGVGTPPRAAELLTGRWSLRYGEPVMPVDAVLVGTAAMACAEAAASPQVKAALVALPGSSEWVPQGGTAGGIHSGRSSLDADIHVADNAAARAAALLAEVAGDAAAVAARHDEIVAALAATAKPWFGDLRTMTYTALLDRFTTLCATGRHTRYHDGPWLDPTHRTRALTLYNRSATRLGATSPTPSPHAHPTPSPATGPDDPATRLTAAGLAASPPAAPVATDATTAPSPGPSPGDVAGPAAAPPSATGPVDEATVAESLAAGFDDHATGAPSPSADPDDHAALAPSPAPPPGDIAGPPTGPTPGPAAGLNPSSSATGPIDDAAGGSVVSALPPGTGGRRGDVDAVGRPESAAVAPSSPNDSGDLRASPDSAPVAGEPGCPEGPIGVAAAADEDDGGRARAAGGFTLGDLDDPVGALAAFRAAFPAADTTLVHPADALAFVEVCDGPGKPVPFVAVIDAEVRRRYMADALWQAQDDRYPADAVFAIPGPAAVAGITRADEPVAELLARFEQGVVDELLAAGAVAAPAARDRVADGGMAPAPFADLARGRTGVLAGFCIAPLVVTEDGGSAPNPLWSLVAPTDDVTVETTADGRLVEVVACPRETADRVVARATSLTEVDVTVTMAGHDLVLRFAVEAGAFHDRTPPPASAVEGEWTWSDERAAAYRAATGARHAGPPVDLAFSLAWPALVARLTEAEDGASPLAGLPAQLEALVHRSHRVAVGPAWPPADGEQGTATARLTEVRNTATDRHIDVQVELASGRGTVAVVEAGLFVRRPPPSGAPARHLARRHDRQLAVAGPAECELLSGHEAVTARPGEAISAGDDLACEIETSSTWPSDGAPARYTAHGRLLRAGTVVAELDLDRTGREAVNPVDGLLRVLAPDADRRRERPRLDLAQADDTAPADMTAFARIGGDHNPLHRSVLAARRAGLDRPVVHGMWTAARTAAFVVDEVADGDPGRLADWSVRFTAPVALGADLRFAATRVAVDDGRWRIEVVVRADDGDADGTVVATATALVAPPVTALVFPGQGTQRPGMGADDRARSRAARAVWDRADAHTRTHQGWSLLDVVERNPVELRMSGGDVVRHPRGVLHRTELAQVALVTQAAAQVADLRATGALPADPAAGAIVAAGHSVGEYGALVALGVLPLEAALDLVFARGRAMQEVVPRDADGASPFRMAAVDPVAAGLDAAGLGDLIARVAADTGELVEVVNHNAAGRQHVVAGTATALGELAARLPSPALRRLDGIDVPFHSSALAPAADRLRPVLERLIGRVDHRRLVGRWIPNLTGRPFTLAPADDPDEQARHQLIDLLARQIASPVHWSATQDALLAPTPTGGLAAHRQIELGPAHSPVLTALAHLTPRPPTIALLHIHPNRDQVLFSDTPRPTPDAPIPSAPTSSPPPANPVARAASDVPVVPAALAGSGGVGGFGDRWVGAGEALRIVLANQARVRLDQLREDETLDELFQGVSSRRNQVLIDLGREFELSGTDGVLELPVARLATEIGARATRYRFPGVYLQATIAAGLGRALGRSGLARRDIAEHLTTAWGLGPGLSEHVLVTLVMETRPGASARGGPLGRFSDDLPTTAADGRRLLDRSVELVAQVQGLDLRPPATTNDNGVDAAAIRRAGERIEGALLGAARRLVTALDRPWAADGEPIDPAEGNGDAARLAVLDRELGADRATEVAGRFDHRRNVRFGPAPTFARWDLVGLYHDAIARRRTADELRAEAERLAIHGDDPAFAATVAWFTDRATHTARPDVAELLTALTPARRTVLVPPAVRPAVEITPDGRLHAHDRPAGDDRRDELIHGLPAALRPSRTTVPDLTGTVALVTGAGPRSIAAELVRHLLRGGATVVATTSTPTRERRHWWRELYRTAAGPRADLHLVPANLAAFADIDALVEWLADPVTPHPHRPDLHNPPLLPDLIVPFAAVPATGEAGDAGAASETALRVQLLGVERLVARIAERRARRGGAAETDPVTVLLPLSPNRGDLGGDGPYGETKAGLEVLARRARSERDGWGRHTRMIGARIGWVRGTGLMQANDVVAELVEDRLGVRTFSAAEMGWLLAAVCTTAEPPDEVDLTGGLADVPDLRGALTPLVNELADRAAVQRRRHDLARALAHELWPDGPPAPPAEAAEPAAPTAGPRPAPRRAPKPQVAARDMVVIVGTGELGPCGTARTRAALELDEPLPDAAVVELAWLCGLAEFQRAGYRGRWVDTATGTTVDEAALADRYRAEVLTRVGLRPLTDDGVIDPAGHEVLTTVHLTDDVTFEVDDEATARSFAATDPTHTEIRHDHRQGDRWTVVRKAGAPVRIPRRTGHSRRVAGQLPTGLDLARLGVPDDLLVTADRMALVNLACTAEAFRHAGIEPEDLLAAVHPVEVANTQGAGMGGLASIRRLLHDHLLDHERQNDRLQESLGNVVAAHAVQGYVGSYGPMVHPVAACATAAVSLEIAHDLVRSGRARAVVAGGYDDLTPEGMVGFGDMHATAASDELDALGLEPGESSRANDVRRRGFVEAQGGGAFLVVRGDVALEMGLPVQGVLVYAGSFGDGIHTSIPAPGMGVLAAASGGAGSPLATALRRHGLDADDIAVVSKHDTSTELNDPNEADLHQRLQDALGRTPGNPLLVVSQKTVTGHAKGGAAAWQVAGVLQTMATGWVPGNRNLDRLDPVLAGHDHLVHGHRALRFAADAGEPVRAALVTSLGFGHVSALLALAHPATFVDALADDERATYLHRAAARRAEAERRYQEVRHGLATPLRRTNPRLGRTGTPDVRREMEAAALLDPTTRLGPDGVLRPGEPQGGG